MRICIVGAGAIGGMLGVKLALRGKDGTFIFRGANLAAVIKAGMTPVMEDGTEFDANPVKATERITEAGVHDLVILGMKAHQVTPVVQDLRSLFGPDTIVVTTQNE